MSYLVDVSERPPFSEGRKKRGESKGKQKWGGRKEGGEILVGMQYVKE